MVTEVSTKFELLRISDKYNAIWQSNVKLVIITELFRVHESGEIGGMISVHGRKEWAISAGDVFHRIFTELAVYHLSLLVFIMEFFGSFKTIG